MTCWWWSTQIGQFSSMVEILRIYFRYVINKVFWLASLPLWDTVHFKIHSAESLKWVDKVNKLIVIGRWQPQNTKFSAKNFETFWRAIEDYRKSPKIIPRFPNIAEESTNTLPDGFRTSPNFSISYTYKNSQHWRRLPEEFKFWLQSSYYNIPIFNDYFSYCFFLRTLGQVITIFIVQFWRHHVLAHLFKIALEIMRLLVQIECNHPERTHYMYA